MMRKTLMMVLVAGLMMAAGCNSDDNFDAHCADNPNDPWCNQNVNTPNNGNDQNNVNKPGTTQCTNMGEIFNGTSCVCDTANHWTEKSGSCVCEDGYFPNGNSCILTQNVGRCPNTGEVYDGTACVCDTVNHWTGTPGSCTCDEGYEPNHGSCAQIQCGTGEILSGSSCTCNTADNWKGTPGNCSCNDGYTQNGNSCIPESYVGKCDKTGEVYDGTACVCDTSNHWTGNSGSCTCASGYNQNGSNCTQIQCGAGEILSGSNCVCNSAAHWSGTPGNCKCAPGYEDKNGTCTQIQCGKGEILLSSSCACDTANHWTGETGSCECANGYEEEAGSCKSLCGKGETMSDGNCVCDENSHWEGTTGSCTCIDGYTETNGKCLENITDAENCLNLAEPAVGKTCMFGKYMQTAAGDDMTDLEWQILKLGDDGSFLMISKRVIDVFPYYVDNDTEVTWAQSTMRSWLNGFGATENLAGTDYTNDNFIQKAFNATEREHIQQVTNTNPKGPMNVPGGVDTDDRVFLLSYNEVKQLFPNDEAREAVATEYALNHDPTVLHPNDCTGDECTAFWLTRTPGDNLQKIIRVFYNGFVCPHGGNVYYTFSEFPVSYGGTTVVYRIVHPADHGVRPAIWVKK